ncbi:unnamed protein product [Didymodactylos carnosus]|uniref:MULE transposase domain-containing protein n=1 Tax=Didymodactylos carnosus TaxID=1234261 RepID=A0A814AAE8_9BILA|nr:unnamed protein product [Didymodactylos carnosus]CAF3691912.1 unnamed protein product [Didymodactylos carnosus]
MEVLHPDLFIDSKIKSAVEYKQQQNRCRIKFIEKLYSWCSQPVDVNNTFICLTTRQLLSTCKHSSVLYIDCTYKVTANELPLLVFGTSDFNRRFYPMDVCLISSDESFETFKIFFRDIQVWASTINNQAYTVSHVMGDGAAGITGAMCELPLASRLMCWVHVILEQDIMQLQLSFSDQIFVTAAKAVEWVKKIDKTQILQLTTFNFVVPSNDQKMNTLTWVNLLHSMAWDSYDHFNDCLHSARLLDFSCFLPPIFCTCRYGLKEFACVHAADMMMLWGTRQMPQEIEKRRGKGRPKKVKYPLSKD